MVDTLILKKTNIDIKRENKYNSNNKKIEYLGGVEKVEVKKNVTQELQHNMRSNTVTDGVQQAPHRSLFHALGLTDEEIKKPLIGIVSSYNEIVPGHMNLDKIVDAVKLGVAMAGGTPIVFPAIAVCDGIAMGHIGMKYSLVTRDLIADSTEAMAMAHQFDALVMVPNCDKNVPGLLMAAARINVPTVFVSGGPMLAGKVKGEKTSLSWRCFKSKYKNAMDK